MLVTLHAIVPRIPRPKSNSLCSIGILEVFQVIKTQREFKVPCNEAAGSTLLDLCGSIEV
ncbi:MAG: hypothetical protein QXR35_00835 [Candidatus Korarchaeum sp.]